MEKSLNAVKYKVALIGSSGGGASTLSSGELIIETIRGQLKQIVSKESAIDVLDIRQEVDICAAALVISQKGFDFIDNEDDANFWVVDGPDRGIQLDGKGPLSYVNARAKYADEKIARMIDFGQVDALISISSDPSGINKLAVEAAIVKGIPIVGTGGTSIGEIATQGGNVVGCSGGSVATTALSRAICCASSLSAYWDLAYQPVGASLKISSVVGAVMPILLTASMANFALKMCLQNSIGTEYEPMFKFMINALTRALPAVISMITCMESSSLQELSMISGAVAGAVLSQGLVSSMLVGFITGKVLSCLIVFCARKSLLPTATTIIAVGCSSIFSALLLVPVSPEIEFYSSMAVTMLQELPGITYSVVLATVTAVYEEVMELSITSVVKEKSQIHASSIEAHEHVFLITTGIVCLIGGLIGWMCSVGSESGYYHSVMLPLIAFEMARNNGFSMVGSYDAVCLCMPAAGVCLAVWCLSSISCIRTITVENHEESKADLMEWRDAKGAIHSGSNSPRGGLGLRRGSGSIERVVPERVEARNQAIQVRCHRHLGWKGFVSNIIMGDFVEACYPYTLASEFYEVDVTEKVLLADAAVEKKAAEKEKVISSNVAATPEAAPTTTSAFTDVPSALKSVASSFMTPVDTKTHTNGSANGGKNGATTPPTADTSKTISRTGTGESFRAILDFPESMFKSMNDGVLGMAEYMNLTPSQQAEVQRKGLSPVPIGKGQSASTDSTENVRTAVRRRSKSSEKAAAADMNGLFESPTDTAGPKSPTMAAVSKKDGAIRARKTRFPVLLFFVRLSCFIAGGLLFLGSAHLYANKHHVKDVTVKKYLFSGARKIKTKSEVVQWGASGYHPVAITSSAYLPAPISILLTMYGHKVATNITDFGMAEPPEFSWTKLRSFVMPKVNVVLDLIEEAMPPPLDTIMFKEVPSLVLNATSNFNHALRDASIGVSRVMDSTLTPHYDKMVESSQELAKKHADRLQIHSYYAKALYSQQHFDTALLAGAAYAVAFGLPFLASLVCLFSSERH
jgi:hypothetical protein